MQREGRKERDKGQPPLQQYLAGCWLGNAAGDAHLWLISLQPAWRCLDQSDSRTVNAHCPAPFPLRPPHSISKPSHPPLFFHQLVYPNPECSLSLSLSFFVWLPVSHLGALFFSLWDIIHLDPSSLVFLSFSLVLFLSPCHFSVSSPPSFHSTQTLSLSLLTFFHLLQLQRTNFFYLVHIFFDVVPPPPISFSFFLPLGVIDSDWTQKV